MRDGANLTVAGYDFAPSFSIWTTIEECLNPPVIWERDRGWFTTAPFSEPEVFDFPEGIGPVECVNVEHEEVLLIPRWLDAERVTFKYGLGEEFIDVLKTLHKLGLDRTEPVEVSGGRRVSTRCRRGVSARPGDARRPDERQDVRRDVGHRHRHRRRPREVYLYHVVDNAWSMSEYGSQAVVWQTAVNPVVALELIADRHLVGRRGDGAGGVRRAAVPRSARRPTAHRGGSGRAGLSLNGMIDLRSETTGLLARMGVDLSDHKGDDLAVSTPITGEELARLVVDPAEAVAGKVGQAVDAFEQWRIVPAPRRGELVRRFGELLRSHKDDLGRLVTIETGKILAEGLGEVQEMIDICDFAVGLSRQLYGLTIASERPGHRMMETWHPLGVGRRDLGVQLPGRRLGVERGARRWCAATPSSGSRRRRRRSPPSPCSALLRARAPTHSTTPGWPVAVVLGGATPARRSSTTRAVAAGSAPPAARRWAGPSGPGSPALRPVAARARRQQRDDRHAVRRPRPGACAPSRSPRPAPPVSAARRCAG